MCLRGGLPRVRGLRYFKSNGEKVFTFDNNNTFYGSSMTQPLAYAEIEFDEKTSSKIILAKPNDAETLSWN